MDILKYPYIKYESVFRIETGTGIFAYSSVVVYLTVNIRNKIYVSI